MSKSGSFSPRGFLSIASCLALLASVGSLRAAGWSIVSSPTITTSTHLNAVTCNSTSDCWAVGYGTGGDQTVIEHWDGSSWSIVGSPNNAMTGRLSGVTCNSASDCWAVGTLIEHWNGTSWSIVSSPSTSGYTTLNSVACASATDCWAVGDSFSSPQDTLIIEHWNGTSWSIVSSPTTSGNNALNSVACPSALECWAVGWGINGGGAAQTLIEKWNGTSWTIATSANTSPSQSNELYGVTCNSATDCWAVGDGGNIDTLTEHWDGSSWSIVSSPDGSNSYSNYLTSVACNSATDCWASGDYFNGDYRTLTEHWDGGSWSVVSSPNYGRSADGLNGVTCSSRSDCWAVGGLNDNGVSEVLIEHWNGTSWVIATTLNVLNGAMCNSATDCWAVGYYDGGAGGVPQTLAEHWDGTWWSIVMSPDTSNSQNNYLNSVACSSASNCWSVGYYVNGSGVSQTLIEQWNGNAWSIVSGSPNNGTRNNVLTGVTCASTSECWAAGYYLNSSGISQTLIEKWDGTSWTIATSANANASQNNELNGVTCTSAMDCWAVGYYGGSSAEQTLIEHWDGSFWSIVGSPNNGASQNKLNGVTCTSTSNCWAVGHYVNGSGVVQTLIEQWNGSVWSIVSGSPNNGALNNILTGVTCASATECWAVGNYANNSGFQQTLIELWDGSSWTLATSPNRSVSQNNYLNGVTCASATECWAVGTNFNSLVNQALIEEYSPIMPPLTSVVSEMPHGPAGPLDVGLPLTMPFGIECRSSTSMGSGNYTVIFTFTNELTSVGSVSVTGHNPASGMGTVKTSGYGSFTNQYTVNLTGVTNAQYVTLALNNVLDSENNSGSVSVTMGVLVGDVNASGRVDAADVSLVRQQTLQPVTTSNFREDINTSGRIDAADVSIARQQTLTSLP